MASKLLSRGLFDARWLIAPFYIGLIVALLLLLAVFIGRLISYISIFGNMSSSAAILMALSLIDLTLVANLLLIVAIAGYDNFVSRIESGSEARPAWMGTIDFADMKMKLMASIIAISAIALLRVFMEIAEGAAAERDRLIWMIAVHLTLMISATLLSVIEYINFKRER